MKLLPYGRQTRLWASVLSPLLGLAVLAMTAGEGGPPPPRASHPLPMPLVRAESQPATELVAVAAPMSGKVLTVPASSRVHVAAGALLVQLDSTACREALAQARARSAEARGRVSMARSDATVKERTVRAAVQTALTAMPSTLPVPPSTPARRRPGDDAAAAALERVRTQLAAAQADVVRTAGAQLALAQRTVERDQSLLGQGMISARQLADDTAAYQSALAQVRAAEASLRRAQAPGAAAADQPSTTRPSTSTTQAHRDVAAAQETLRAAQDEVAAAQQTLDRDKALLAEGAIPAQQVTVDTVNYDAANARAVAASAALRQAQAQLESARARPQRVLAATRHELPRTRDLSRAEGLVRQAQAAIVAAQQAERRLAAAQAQAVAADGAIRDAELNLDRTSIRAPIDGLVTNNTARPGDPVRSGQLLVWLAAPRQAAMRLQQLRHVAQDPAAANQERLGQIAAEEHRALTRLQAESERIGAISRGASGADHIGSTPTFLSDGLSRPVWGEITSGYGWRIHPIFQTPEFHTGIDIAAQWGTPVQAPADGRVIYAGTMAANGMLLIVDHGNGFTTTYSHLSSYAVGVGQRVHRGQVIARVGSTGWSTGPHLFFEVREGGRPINPLAP